MNEINNGLLKKVQQDPEKYYEDFKQMYKEVSGSKAIYKGAPVPFLYIPKIFTKKDIIKFNDIVINIFDIVNRMINLYLEKEEVRAFFGFDKRLEELILMEHRYTANVPMGRFDIFYYPDGGFKFCELNTDGSSAMNEDMVLSSILSKSAIMDEISEQYEVNSFELFDTWVKEVQRIYDESGGKEETPVVAIVDFIDKSSSIEFKEFKERFDQHGFDCLIVDPRNITVNDGLMYAEDKKIDIVYRRLVTRDMMERIEEIQEFIEGLKNNKTCVIGPIKSQIVHTKRFFEALYQEEIRAYYTAEELVFIDNHIPYTKKLAKDDHYNEYIENKDKFILKPTDLYASKGVYAGKDHTMEEWQAILDTSLESDYMIQEFCKPSVSENVLFNAEGQPEVHYFNNITGMYVYNENFYGLYSRVGLNSIISGLHDCYTLPSFIAREKAK